MRRALWMSSGVIVWALHFTFVYGFTGLACARGLHAAVPWTVGLASVAAAAVAAFIAWRAVPRRGEFEHAVAAGLAAFALVAILWEGVPVLVVTPCASR